MLTENSVRSENAAVPIIREIMVATRVVKKLAAARILLKKSKFLLLIDVSVSAAFNELVVEPVQQKNSATDNGREDEGGQIAR